MVENGGKWKPSKTEDELFLGKPGEIKITYLKDGTKVETKIDSDGRAIRERHLTSSPNPKYHSNPHDHEINWESPLYGIPNFVKPHQNYWPEEFPDGAPEFKSVRSIPMNPYMFSSEHDPFHTISEFKEGIIRGGEPVFSWNGIRYGVCFHESGYCIASADGSNEKICTTPDEVLEYMVGTDHLQDVITKVDVLSRTI